jgi:hypothetical protein
MRKLNSMQKNLTEKEKDNMKKASKLEKEISKAKGYTKSNKPIPSDYEMPLEDYSDMNIYMSPSNKGTNFAARSNSKGKQTNQNNRSNNEWGGNADKSANNIKVLDSYIDTENENHEGMQSLNSTIVAKSNNAINLKEINQRLKKNPQSSQSTIKQIDDTTLENTHKLASFCECPSDKDYIVSPKIDISSDLIYTPKSNNNEIDQNFLSLKVDSNIPSDLFQFGKYLIKYIEQEENYRLLFDKEYKKLKQKIKTTFEKENTSDHCLLDYLFELWDKLDISYVNRYKILSELSRLNSRAIYKTLDRETEALTDYYQRTNTIFQLIKDREKLKVRLQNKSNKSKYPFNFRYYCWE